MKMTEKSILTSMNQHSVAIQIELFGSTSTVTENKMNETLPDMKEVAEITPSIAIDVIDAKRSKQLDAMLLTPMSENSKELIG